MFSIGAMVATCVVLFKFDERSGTGAHGRHVELHIYRVIYDRERTFTTVEVQLT